MKTNRFLQLFHKGEMRFLLGIRDFYTYIFTCMRAWTLAPYAYIHIWISPLFIVVVAKRAQQQQHLYLFDGDGKSQNPSNDLTVKIRFLHWRSVYGLFFLLLQNHKTLTCLVHVTHVYVNDRCGASMYIPIYIIECYSRVETRTTFSTRTSRLASASGNLSE